MSKMKDDNRLTVLYFTDDCNTTVTLKQIHALCPNAQILMQEIEDPVYRNKYIGDMLLHAEGKYITAVDEGDQFTDDFFQLPFKKKNKERLIISCSKRINDQVLNNEGDCCENTDIIQDGIVDLNINVFSFPVTLNGTWVPNIQEYIALWQDKGIESEKNFLLRILLQKQKYFCYGSKVYTYIHPRDCHFGIYSGEIQREWYIEAVDDFLIPLLQEVESCNGSVPMFLQYFALYFILCRMAANKNNRNKHVIQGKTAKNYKDKIGDILQYVDDSIILHDRDDQNYYHKDAVFIRLLLQMKYNNYDLDFEFYMKGNTLLLGYKNYIIQGTGKIHVNVQFIEYSHGKWEMDLSVPSLYSKDRVNYYVMLDNKKYPVAYRGEYSLTKYFGQAAYKRISFHASVPIKEKSPRQELQFIMSCNGRDYMLSPEYKSHTSRLSNSYRYAYWRFGKYIAFQKGKSIIIRPAKKWYVAYREIRSLWEMLTNSDKEVRRVGRLRLIYHLSRPKYKNKKIWMFYDKIYKGGDSSEYLYKYSAKKKDGIDCYYLIDKNAPDCSRLKQEGFKPLIRGTLKHRLVFLNADMMIISNSTVFAFNDYSLDLSAYIRDLVKFHVCCVQHGMSVQKIAVAQRRLRDNTRLYFCASKYEIENLMKPVYDYAGHDALRLTGVPRYDGLVNRAKKQILLSPTWRMQAAMLVSKNEGVERDYNPLFKETAYYKVFNSLINDPRLLYAVKKYGYRIHYVLHPIVSPQVDDFDKNDYVDIIPAVSDMSYEKEFCESSLMITDFSGIQFDFAYMRKPLIYLHHNAIPQHYAEGTFHYKTMGFGEIVHNNDDLIDLLIDYMKNDCKMKDEYRRRADDFFYYNDHNNCERIYKEMIVHQKNVVDRVNKLN